MIKGHISFYFSSAQNLKHRTNVESTVPVVYKTPHSELNKLNNSQLYIMMLFKMLWNKFLKIIIDLKKKNLVYRLYIKPNI